MKIATKNLIATALTLIVLTGSAFASDNKNNNQNITVLNDVKNISKIKVSGNVELILVQSLNESVKVYDNYYSQNALVQQQNGELFISSFKAEKLTVVAYVNRLSGVEASDNAEIKTFGKLNLLSFSVKLKNNASADMNVNAVVLKTDVSGNSSLTLSGSAEDHKATISSVAKLNTDRFVADTTQINAKNTQVAPTVAQDLNSIKDQNIG